MALSRSKCFGIPSVAGSAAQSKRKLFFSISAFVLCFAFIFAETRSLLIMPAVSHYLKSELIFLFREGLAMFAKKRYGPPGGKRC